MGDIVDAQDLSNGAWFEAKIVKITKASDDKTSQDEEMERKISKGDGNNNDTLSQCSHSNQTKSNDLALTNQKDSNGTESMECDTRVASKGIDSTDSDTAGEKTSSNSLNDSSHDSSKTSREGTSNSSEAVPVAKEPLVCVLSDDDPYLYHVTYEG